MGCRGLTHPSWAFSLKITQAESLAALRSHQEAWGSSLMSLLHNFLLLREL